MIVKLTTEFIANNLICPGNKNRFEYVDEGRTGLYIEVKANTPGRGVFYYRFKDANTKKTRHRRIASTDEINLRGARERVKILKAEILLGKNSREEGKTNDSCILFHDFFQQHYMSHAKVHCRGWKKKSQMYDLQLKEAFGSKQIGQVKRHDVTTWQLGLREAGLSPAYADRFLALLRHILNKAVEYEMLEKNPAAGVKMFNPDNSRDYRLNGEELARLVATLNSFKNRNVALIAQLALSSGMRIGEILKMQWADIDRQNKLLRIPAANSKSKKSRSIPLNDSAMKVLDQLDTEGKFDHVFINRKTGKPLTTISRQWVKVREAAGLPRLRIHDLRHQFASLLVNEGVSLYIVKSLLGHSQISTTEKYSHLASDSLLKSSGLVADIINDINDAQKKTA